MPANPTTGVPLSVRVLEGPGALVDTGEITGMSLGIIDASGTHVFGLGRVSRARDDRRVPDGRTIYEIGSISKVFTGILLGEMVARGEARLDEPVAELLPAGTRVPERNGERITLERLATHSSGLPRLPTNLGVRLDDPYRDYDDSKLYAFLKDHELERDPGAGTEYSNLAVGLLGHALHVRAGKPSYEALLVDRICDPLGMGDTRITLRPDMKERLAAGFNGLGLPASNWDLAVLAGAGGIRSSVSDMLRLARFCLAPDDSPLGRGVRLSLEPRRIWKPGQGEIGLNWLRLEGGVAFHNGETGGYHSVIGLRPEQGTALVTLTNRAFAKAEKPAQELFNSLAPIVAS